MAAWGADGWKRSTLDVELRKGLVVVFVFMFVSMAIQLSLLAIKWQLNGHQMSISDRCWACLLSCLFQGHLYDVGVGICTSGAPARSI